MKIRADNIRNMSDKELYTFLNNISNQNGRVCCKCGQIVFKDQRITLFRNVDVATKKICCLCKECYSDLLDYLGVNDCE